MSTTEAIRQAFDARNDARAEVEALYNKADAAGGLTPADKVAESRLLGTIKDADDRIAAALDADEREAVIAEQEARFLALSRTGAQEPAGPFGSTTSVEDAGLYLRALATGSDSDMPEEFRAQSVGTANKGGYATPTPVASTILDLVTNRMRVREAGATIVPITSQTQKLPKLDGRPTVAWRAEAAAVGESDLTIGSVPFTSNSLGCLVKFSVEVEQDVPTIGATVANALADAMALELDRVALYGTGASNQPAGLFPTTITPTYLGANGGNIAWTDLNTAVVALQAANYDPTAVILAPRTEGKLAVLAGSDGHYLEPPSTVANVKRLTTSQVSTTTVRGSSGAVCSEVFVGDWSQLALGIRQEVTILPVREAFMANGQVGLYAFLRADVQVLRTAAFAVIGGVL
jgi:HK97 family phage major capsid protein